MSNTGPKEYFPLIRIQCDNSIFPTNKSLPYLNPVRSLVQKNITRAYNNNSCVKVSFVIDFAKVGLDSKDIKRLVFSIFYSFQWNRLWLRNILAEFITWFMFLPAKGKTDISLFVE